MSRWRSPRAARCGARCLLATVFGIVLVAAANGAFVVPAAEGAALSRAEPKAIARASSSLASDAFRRSALVAERWLDRRDGRTGLFPHTLRGDRHVWTYGDAGADLYPFLGIATALLLPERMPEVLDVLAAERAASPGLPRDVDLRSGRPVARESEKELLAAVEYAKDGLLPLVERLGPDPWLPRLREVIDAAMRAATTPTSLGPIFADSAEVNGSALQVLARLYWLTREPRYLDMGRRVAAAYLDDALPDSQFVPPLHWNFVDDRSIGPRYFSFGDHGNEIVSGLVEWHRVERLVDAREADGHRVVIRRMLNRLLREGRTPEGLWYETIAMPSGRVRDDDVSDNWGYLGQAYLNQAAVERGTPDGDPAVATRYERVSADLLRAATAFRGHPWEDGTMDGYADTLEGALYLLHYLDVPEAADWVDQQIAGLYAFQKWNGAVTQENIDGNFIRTALLYAFSKTRGARLDPWQPGVDLGAAPDGECTQVFLRADSAWVGRLIFDTPRHRDHLGLPGDYPRLNQWPEYFAVERERAYRLTDATGERIETGRVLADGLNTTLQSGEQQDLRVCPS